MPTDNDELGPYWRIIHRLRGVDQPREPLPEETLGRTYPGELVIGTSANRILARIQPDGSVIYGDDYTPDEAAVTLWTAIGSRRPGFDRRMQYMELLDLHIALIAVADQAYETAQAASRAAQAAAQAEDSTETERVREDTERFREEMSRRNLETRIHGIIEFAREYASMRPDLIEQARQFLPGTGSGTEGNPIPPRR